MKCYMLDHLSDDIQSHGGLRPIGEGSYENAHLLFKNQYRKNNIVRRPEEGILFLLLDVLRSCRDHWA